MNRTEAREILEEGERTEMVEGKCTNQPSRSLPAQSRRLLPRGLRPYHVRSSTWLSKPRGFHATTGACTRPSPTGLARRAQLQPPPCPEYHRSSQGCCSGHHLSSQSCRLPRGRTHSRLGGPRSHLHAPTRSPSRSPPCPPSTHCHAHHQLSR